MSLFGNSVSFLDPMGPYDYSVSTHTPYIGLMDWRGRWAVDHHSRNGSGLSPAKITRRAGHLPIIF